VPLPRHKSSAAPFPSIKYPSHLGHIGPSFSIYSSIHQPCLLYLKKGKRDEREVENCLACASPERDRPWRAAHRDSPFTLLMPRKVRHTRHPYLSILSLQPTKLLDLLYLILIMNNRPDLIIRTRVSCAAVSLSLSSCRIRISLYTIRFAYLSTLRSNC
jgi:hypothetical protein